VLDQDAAAGGALGGDGDHQRDRQAQRVWAGDDEDGDGANDRIVGEPEESPNDCGDQGSTEGEPEQQGGGAVGDALGAGGGALRLGDEPVDARQSRVVAGGGDLHAQAGVSGHGASSDVLAFAARDGARCAGDHGLVHIGATVDDGAVGGDAATGADDDDVTDAEVGGVDRDDVVALDALGRVRQ